MAARTCTTASFTRFPIVARGRSGYNNKPDEEDETKDQGRSGYNKGGKGDEDDDE